MIEDLKNIKSTKKELKEFGLTVGGILVILGLVGLWRNKGFYPYFLGIGISLVILGISFNKALMPFQKFWIGLAVILGFFVSRIVLFILFYFTLMPTGLIMRLLGKDVLDQKIDKNRKSYWHERKDYPKDKHSYENQY